MQDASKGINTQDSRLNWMRMGKGCAWAMSKWKLLSEELKCNVHLVSMSINAYFSLGNDVSQQKIR